MKSLWKNSTAKLSKMEYSLMLNLQQKATLSTAISFWEQKEVKNRMKEFLSSCNKSEICNAKKEWRKFIKAIVKEWNKPILPPLLDVELIYIVKEIGEKIFNWYKYFDNENIIDFMDQIYWTSFGTIDEVKILKLLLLKNSNLNVDKVYNLVCRYALEEHINDLSDKISSEILPTTHESLISVDRYIMAYWIHHTYDSDGIFGFSFLYFSQIVSENYSATENMLRLSVCDGYSIAMKYFWDKLTKEERNRNVVECARIAVMRYNYYIKIEQKYTKKYQKYPGEKGFINKLNEKDLEIKCHKKEKYIEICIFLMNQMTKDHKRAFFDIEIESYFQLDGKIDIKDVILNMLLSAWPWQKFFIPVLKDILQYQDHNSTMRCTFFNTIANKMVEDYELDYFVEINKHQSLLREAWLIIPKTIKQKAMLKCTKKDLICHLIDSWDLDNLKLILDDPAVITIRNQLIDFAFSSYKKFVLNDQFEKLNQLMDEIFIFKSEEKKRNFKWSIFFRNRFVDKNERFIKKMLLNWDSLTPEEQETSFSKLLESFNYYDGDINICHELMDSGKFIIVDKFINWTFETEQEKKNCIHYFVSDKFLISKVYKIWQLYRVKEAEMKSFQFLHWLLKSSEEIERFKQEKLVNFKDNYAFQLFVFQYVHGNWRDLLSWCLLPYGKIEKITQLVFQSELYKMLLKHENLIQRV